MAITFKGDPLTLTGTPVAVGDTAPDFTVIAQDLSERTLADYAGKIKVMTTFPSLDTPVCDLQVKEFNKRAATVADNVVIIGISKDLPFAQARFCAMNDITGVEVVSDYKTSVFGERYGLLIEELNLLARAVIIVDTDTIVQYVEIVAEVTNAPDYDEVTAALTKLVG